MYCDAPRSDYVVEAWVGLGPAAGSFARRIARRMTDAMSSYALPQAWSISLVNASPNVTDSEQGSEWPTFRARADSARRRLTELGRR
jgi:hypothetical protein